MRPAAPAVPRSGSNTGPIVGPARTRCQAEPRTAQRSGMQMRVGRRGGAGRGWTVPHSAQPECGRLNTLFRKLPPPGHGVLLAVGAPISALSG
ncbi:unnamed protein product [Gadus morhua 'NCC']